MHYTIVGSIYIAALLLNILEVKKITNDFPNITSVIALAILITFMPILIFLLCFFAVYKWVIHIILKTTHEKKFYGLLSGLDTFNIIGEGDTSNFITNVCIMVRCEKYTSEEFYEITKEAFSKIGTLAKFRTSLCKFFGYWYLIKEERNLYDCMFKMKTVECPEKRIDKERFYELLNYHYNEPMPSTSSSPYQILIGTQPINWKDDDVDYYPVLFRTLHVIGDGISLMKAFMGVIADKLDDSAEHINTLRLPKKNQLVLFGNKQIKMIISTWEILKTSVFIFILYPSSIIVCLTYKANDVNILYNTSLTQQSVVGISSEQNMDYVNKIRRIKQKFPETAFSTVLITAISASLNDYFNKNCAQPPQYITISVPVNIGGAKLRYLTPKQVSLSGVNLTNDYYSLLMKIPIAIENMNNLEFPANKQFINRLNLINKQVDILKRSWEYQISRAFLQIGCGVLPQFFLKLIIGTMRCTTIVSIVAGQSAMTYYNGQMVVKDIVAWVPLINGLGTSICIFTYDGRIHMGVSADKALISDRNDIQRIMDNIYKYLDMMEKEVEEHYKENF